MAGAVGSSSASAAALDALEETFNSLLIQMGSVFHNLLDTGQGPRPDNRHLTKCNAHMKQFVPQALSQFQDNLDSLESELVRAQQTIRRDLLLSRIKPEPTQELTAVEAEATVSAPIQNDKDTAEMVSTDKKEEAANEDAGDGKANATKQDEIPASATSDDGLDAMFNDLTNPDPAPAEGESLADQPNSQTADDTKQGAENDNNNNNTSNANDGATNNDDADVSSLLPGLETYANDNALPDFPSGDFGGDLGDGGGFGDGGADDFNFDDLIQGFGGGGGGVDGSGTADVTMTDFNQFDDDFFNIDSSAT